MQSQHPNPERLIKQLDLKLPVLGFYDVPDPIAFEPTI